jgi:hypothetical protein
MAWASHKGIYAMSKNNRTIKVSGSYIEGNVNIQNGDFVGGNQNKTITTQWFSSIYQAINKRPRTSSKKKLQLQAQVTELEQELQKENKADKNFLAERLDNIKKMAPDIWEVILTTMSSPSSGLTLVAQKLFKKIAEESKQVGN